MGSQPKSSEDTEPEELESSNHGDNATIGLPGCRHIYAPPGQAGEYAPLATNPYRGCGHGCAYCYVPGVVRMTRPDFDKGAVLKETYFEGLLKDAAKYQRAGITEQVMLSFTSDPYHLDDTAPTRQTLEILLDHGMAFCTLSKGGARALRDLDLFRPDRDAYAATLTSLNDAFSLKWERRAALPADRIATLKKFHEAGIFTWVSIEPTLDIESSLEIVRATHDFVDLYKVGQANHVKEITRTTDWRGYTHRMIELMAQLGQPHYIKKDLQPYLPPGYHNPLRVAQHHGEPMPVRSAPAPTPVSPPIPLPIAQAGRLESSNPSGPATDAPPLADLEAAGAADAEREGGYLRQRTEESFHYWMRQGDRCHYAYEAHGLRGKRLPGKREKSYEEFANNIGVGYDAALDLLDLFPLKSRILAKITTDKEIAENKGKPYKYPTWRTALKWFKPQPEKTPPVADEESETPVADDLAAKNFTLQSDLKTARDREFELTGRIQELEAENATLREKLAAVQAPDKAPEPVKEPSDGLTGASMIPPGTLSGIGAAAPRLVRRKAKSPPSEVPEVVSSGKPEDLTPRALAELVNAAAARASEKGLTCEIIVQEFAPIYARVVHKGLKGKQEFADAASFLLNTRLYSVGAYPKKPYVSDCILFWDQEKYVSMQGDNLIIETRMLPTFPDPEDDPPPGTALVGHRGDAKTKVEAVRKKGQAMPEARPLRPGAYPRKHSAKPLSASEKLKQRQVVDLFSGAAKKGSSGTKDAAKLARTMSTDAAILFYHR
jgi:DNA repair photolyase